jgi:hypothetical protein
MDDQNSDEEEIDVGEMLAWAEFCAWSALLITPIVWWLQGPSVSIDQLVVRTALVIISGLAGIGLRIRAIVARRHTVPAAQEANESAGQAGATPGP